MKSLLETAKECGATLHPCNGGMWINDESQLKAIIDAVNASNCEPIGEVHKLDDGWVCYLWEKAVDDGLIKDGQFVYAAPRLFSDQI